MGKRIKEKLLRLIIDCAIICLIILGYHQLVIKDAFDVTGKKYRDDVKKLFNQVKAQEDSLQIKIDKKIDSLDLLMSNRLKKISKNSKKREDEKTIIRNADSVQLDSILRSAGIEPVVLQ